MNKPGSCHQNRGAVLFVGLIMLILITLLAVSAIRLANTNIVVVGNEQSQMEAEDAANYHLDLALNSSNFITQTTNDTEALPAFSGTSASDATSYTVTIPAPKCKRYRYIKKSELVNADNSVPTDNLACFGSSSSQPITIVDTASLTGNSLCATALWEITADVQLPGNGTHTQVTQGIEVRVDYAEAAEACK